MEVVQFNYNTDGSSEFATSDGVGQATAMVVYNSGVSNVSFRLLARDTDLVSPFTATVLVKNTRFVKFA